MVENWQGAYLNEDEATSRDRGDLGLTRQKRKLYYKEAFEKHLGSREKRNEQQKPYPHHTR